MRETFKKYILKIYPAGKKRGKFVAHPLLSKPITKLNLYTFLEKLWSLSLQKWIMIIITSVIIGMLLSPNISLPKRSYKLGDIARRNIKANNDLLIEDELSTEKRRQKAAEELRPIYDFDQAVISRLEEKLSYVFSMMRENYQKDEEEDGKTEKAITRQEFEKILGVTLSGKNFNILAANNFNPDIESHIFFLVTPILLEGVVSNKNILLNEGGKGIILRNVQTKVEEFHEDSSSILGLKEAKKQIIPRANKNLTQLKKPLRNVIIKISQGFVTPNVTFNKNETEDRRQKTLQEVKPVFFQVKRGEMIIREGEKVNEEHLLKLAAMTGVDKGHKAILVNMGLTFLTILILYIAYRLYAGNIKQFSKGTADLLLLAIILLVEILLVKATIFIARAVSEGFPQISADSLLHAVPITFGAMLISILLSAEIAFLFSLLVSIFAAWLLEQSMTFFVYFVIGNVIAVMGVARCTQRTDLIKAGFFVGLINVITILFLKMMEGEFIHLPDLFQMAFGFTGGILAGIIVTGITPLFEDLFGYNTNIRLLELANLNQPVLRDLMVQAPGTYHHSMIVGSLVEAAAESIGANPLLAKVSAFYHDIGKIKKPLYFVENQKDNVNKHSKLAPSMSSLILISHVKDGVEVARANRLGKSIIDIIQQHHGTGLISYFYQKAKKQENPEVQSVDEKDYRYPGPKPQTKEAGLVLLADAVEATSKTLSDPTPSRIKGLVQKVINSSFADGQLDECDLTLNDLFKIAKSFTQVLNGIFHRRIDYPEAITEKSGEEKKPNGNIDKQSTRQTKGNSKKNKGSNQEDLKQIKS